MKPDTRFLDVGANVGYFSVLAAKRCPQGTVDAVEPHATLVAFLRMNLWLHARHASIWPVALGDSDGVVPLDSEPHNYGDTRVAGKKDSGGLLAAMARGDELFEGRSFDVIKVDVQGFEREVLEGMRDLIQRARHLVIVAEFMPRAIQQRGLHPLEVLAGYRRLGLRPVTCIEDRLEAMDDRETLSLCLRSGPEGFVNLLLHKG
jgi:FkbM family methyltransferase